MASFARNRDDYAAYVNGDNGNVNEWGDNVNSELEAEPIPRSLASYNGHLERGDTRQLRHRIFQGFVPKRDEENRCEP